MLYGNYKPFDLYKRKNGFLPLKGVNRPFIWLSNEIKKKKVSQIEIDV